MRWQVGLAALVAAAVLVPAAEAQAPAKSVTTVGAASVSVKPKDRKSNESIRAAVEAANASAQPKAIGEAREQATALATAAGLTLGAITSISDAPTTPYFIGPYGAPYGLQGTFGPGKFCGVTRTAHLKHLADGKTRRVLGKPHRICRIPPSVTVSVTVTFAAA